MATELPVGSTTNPRWADAGDDGSPGFGNVSPQRPAAAAEPQAAQAVEGEERVNDKKKNKSKGKGRGQGKTRAEIEFPTEGPFTAFVSGLPASVVEDDLGYFFYNEKTCVPNDIKIHQTKDGRAFAIVQFDGANSLRHALKKHGEIMEKQDELDGDGNPMGYKLTVRLDDKNAGKKAKGKGPREDKFENLGRSRRGEGGDDWYKSNRNYNNYNKNYKTVTVDDEGFSKVEIHHKGNAYKKPEKKTEEPKIVFKTAQQKRIDSIKKPTLKNRFKGMVSEESEREYEEDVEEEVDEVEEESDVEEEKENHKPSPTQAKQLDEDDDLKALAEARQQVVDEVGEGEESPGFVAVSSKKNRNKNKKNKSAPKKK